MAEIGGLVIIIRTLNTPQRIPGSDPYDAIVLVTSFVNLQVYVKQKWSPPRTTTVG